MPFIITTFLCLLLWFASSTLEVITSSPENNLPAAEKDYCRTKEGRSSLDNLIKDLT